MEMEIEKEKEERKRSEFLAKSRAAFRIPTVWKRAGRISHLPIEKHQAGAANYPHVKVGTTRMITAGKSLTDFTRLNSKYLKTESAQRQNEQTNLDSGNGRIQTSKRFWTASSHTDAITCFQNASRKVQSTIPSVKANPIEDQSMSKHAKTCNHARVVKHSPSHVYQSHYKIVV